MKTRGIKFARLAVNFPPPSGQAFLEISHVSPEVEYFDDTATSTFTPPLAAPARTAAAAPETIPAPHHQKIAPADSVLPPPVEDTSDEIQPSDRTGRWSNGMDWPVVIWIAVVHLGALAAPFYFSWQALLICVGLAWLTGSVGVCMGYHRYLTHGSFTTYRPVRWFLALVGGWSGEGSAIQWVANHRKHHAHSDQEGDPHSPRHGGFWSHMLWFMPDFGKGYASRVQERWAPDLLKEPMLKALHYAFLPSHFILGGVLFALGYYGWNLDMGISFVLWGMFVRLLYVLHVTWFVNSATHIWGYRNYETTDDSRNLWWVGLLAWGEGWHNNHHAFQRMAKHGHRWWEVDMTYLAICAMEKVGLAWNVVHEVPARQRVLEERGYLSDAKDA